MDATTEELVSRARQGDADACELLVRRHLRAAYAVALAVVGSTADAEDVAQEAFLVAFERLDSCREPARFSGWLLQIVRRRAYNALDHRRVRTTHAGALMTENAERSRVDALRQQTPAVGRKERLLEALGHLSPIEREVLLLHDLEGRTHGEIAAALAISEVGSRQHLFKGRHVLRRLLTGESDTEVGHG
ncbi:MAG: RNA polymerase sigma factor [Deltaproteobacteria bacterium]|nr:RNA polymerase sigma factor [Deltaproteobacteria bacterium]